MIDSTTERAAWRPTASLEMLRARAGLLAGIRAFFERVGVMEVETPVCSRHGTTDPALESFTTRYIGPGAARGEERYLQTSPEFPMKRLLAAGSGAIYQICKVFRGGELGARHNPEFTLLEWYRPGFDHFALMQEVAQLVNSLSNNPRKVERMSYAEAFQRHLGLDPHLATVPQLKACAIGQGIAGAESLELDDRDGWLDLLLTHRIEPHLGRGRMTFLHAYPPSQAALARISAGNPPVAERFELYLEGVEIANGFHELSDPHEQQRRFEQENRTRAARGLPLIPMDRHLLSALTAGLPDTAGVALGVDRLLMILTGVSDLACVLAFPFDRA